MRYRLMYYCAVIIGVSTGFFLLSGIAYLSSKNFKGNAYTKELDWIENARTVKYSKTVMIVSLIVAVVSAIVWVLGKLGYILC